MHCFTRKNFQVKIKLKFKVSYTGGDIQWEYCTKVPCSLRVGPSFLWDVQLGELKMSWLTVCSSRPKTSAPFFRNGGSSRNALCLVSYFQHRALFRWTVDPVPFEFSKFDTYISSFRNRIFSIRKKCNARIPTDSFLAVFLV